MASRVREVNRAGRSDATRKVRVAAGDWSPLYQRSDMHIVRANFLMLDATGSKMPADLKSGMEKTVTSKADVISWLKRSLEAVKQAHASETPADMQRKRDSLIPTVDGIFLRIIVHNNEHMGQLVAYARMTGVVPPWSQ